MISGVMISHRNVIANTIQMATFEAKWRDSQKQPGQDTYLETCLGLLPMSHIYSLVVACHVSTYRGDSVIVLPKFDMDSCLKSIQQYKIQNLYLVPPIVILLAKTPGLDKKYDLSSVTSIFTGAAPLGEETADELQRRFPTWAIRQGYGMTESCTVVR